MKHIYFNLMIWAVSLCSMSLNAQTVTDNHKAMLPQLGKLQWEESVKAMIKPKMPVTRISHDRMHFPITSHSASLRATAQAMQLDSVVYCSSEGEKQNKYVYQYNAVGKVTEELGYSWNDPNWTPISRYLYEYDENGNLLSYSYYMLNGSEWQLYWKDVYTYDSSNNRTSLSYNYYDAEGEMTSQSYYEYNSKGYQTKYEYKELRNGVLTLVEQGQYVYNSENKRTHSERQLLDENGEWYYTFYYDYGYDSQGNQTLYETYNWDADKKELYLEEGYYYEYDDNGYQTYYENKQWNGSGYDKNISKFVYNADGMRVYYEIIDDLSSYYRHYIEELSYADDKLSGTSSSIDTTIWKDDSSKSVEMYSIDYTYDSKGYELSSIKYVVDPETGERTTKIYTDESTYDSQNRLSVLVYAYYENGLKTSNYKSEYEYLGEGRSYIQNYYQQDLETEEWTLISRYRYEYEETGEDSYYYRHSDWDMESEEWVVTSGSKYEYEKDGNSYTQINYNWDTESNDWMITYGYKYVDETDGESYTSINAEYDVTNNNWVIFYSDKAEATEGNPMIIKRYYLPENDLENWQMYSIDYYYYSESSVANETIQAVDARIYTRPGTIHVDMEGKAALSVYAANGACCYQSSITGSTVVSNLQRGIYFVVLQGDSGTKKVKVLVK